jgi:phage/plasmid-like protein (TIGR03299 family)
MSAETMEWLNTQTLIGFTSKRGNAWHYDETKQGDEPNHYPDAIPVEDVRRRLFNWTPVKTPIQFYFNGELRTSERRIVILRSDTGADLGMFKDGYEPHDYNSWLVENVETILDDSLAIGSAGLLRGGAVAWVSVEVPENITTPEGVEFRPNLLATTSFDGTIATTYKRCITNVVCDNTMAAGLGEAGQSYKLKHTKYSAMKLLEARDAVAIIHSVADDFAAEVKALCETTVTDKQFSAFLDSLVPVPEDEGRGRTMAENKRDELKSLYANDTRVSPWAGTAYGVLQMVNTFTHHGGIVRGASRQERNMLRAINGGVDKLDKSTIETLTAVLA